MPTTKCLLNTLLLFAVPLAGCSTLHGNFHTVDEGRFYRSGQLHGAGLSRRLEKHTIRAVVSLRDPDQGESWYIDEISTCRRLGVEHYDVPWSKEVLPSPESLVRLIDIYNSTGGPLLVHCQGGVHRSAVASAVYLLQRGASLEEARGQLGAFFNAAPIGKLLDLYATSSKSFAMWVREDYPQAYASQK